MKKSLILTTAALLAVGSIYLFADDDDYEERYERRSYDSRYDNRYDAPDRGYDSRDTMSYDKRYDRDAAAYDERDERRGAASTYDERYDRRDTSTYDQRYDRYEATPYNQRYHSAYPSRRDGTLSGTAEAKLYKNECGSCHMAYQPGLLPKRSWNRMMMTLEDHFGTDASLEKEDATKIATYLNTHAANAMPAGKHMRKIAMSVSPDAPMQMTKSSYFIKEHRQIPIRFVKQPEVKSLANCNACHQDAEMGNYGERGILIPNYGRWDD